MKITETLLDTLNDFFYKNFSNTVATYVNEDGEEYDACNPAMNEKTGMLHFDIYHNAPNGGIIDCADVLMDIRRIVFNDTTITVYAFNKTYIEFTL